MFETNGDIDLDDDILSSSFTPSCPKVHVNNGKTTTAPFQESKEQSLHFHTQPAVEAKSFNAFQKPMLNVQNIIQKVANLSNNSPIKKVVKRKFPGPAGLLPDEATGIINLEHSESKRMKDKNEILENDEILCSQKSASIFESGPWMEMVREFRSSGPDSVFLPDKYNIRWIKSNACMKRFLTQKVPFLAAIIESIEANSALTSINLTLKDMTGEIDAAIICNLYNEYPDELTIGSVIVLKQFGVFTTGNNRHYLTITHNNLITIYSRNAQLRVAADPKNVNAVAHGTAYTFDNSQKSIRKIQLQRISSAEISEQVNLMMMQQKSPTSNDILVPKLPSFNCDRLQKPTMNFSDQTKLNCNGYKGNIVSTQSCAVNQASNLGNSQSQKLLESLISNMNQNNPKETKINQNQRNKPQNIFDMNDDFDFNSDIDIVMGSLEVPNVVTGYQDNNELEVKTCTLENESTSNNASIRETLKSEHENWKITNDREGTLEQNIKYDEQGEKEKQDTLKDVLEFRLHEDSHIEMSNESKSFSRNEHSSEIEALKKQTNVFLECDQLKEPPRKSVQAPSDDESCGKVNIKNKLEMFKFIPKNCDTDLGANNQKPFANMDGNKITDKENLNTTNDSSIIISSSQLSVKTTNVEHNQIWKNALDNIDTDALFEDF